MTTTKTVGWKPSTTLASAVQNGCETYGVSDLKSARRKLGLTQAQLAEQLGVTRQTIQNHERRSKGLVYLAGALNMIRKAEIEAQWEKMGGRPQWLRP